MKYLCYTLTDDTPMPARMTPEQMAAMGDLLAETMAAGLVVATGALAPADEGFTLRYDDGDFTVTDGPFAEAKELVGGWTLIDVPSKEDALALAERFMRVTGGGVTTIRPTYVA